MGDVIYLNDVRKKRAEDARRNAAAADRARHGRSRQAKEASRREKEREAAALNARLLEDKSGAKGEPERG